MMAHATKCPRGHFYIDWDFCPTCRLADLEEALRQVVDAHELGGQALLLLKIRAARKLIVTP